MCSQLTLSLRVVLVLYMYVCAFVYHTVIALCAVYAVTVDKNSPSIVGAFQFYCDLIYLNGATFILYVLLKSLHIKPEDPVRLPLPDLSEPFYADT